MAIAMILLSVPIPEMGAGEISDMIHLFYFKRVKVFTTYHFGFGPTDKTEHLWLYYLILIIHTMEKLTGIVWKPVLATSCV